MALIGKIREKSALLVILIGLALLAFIMGDWQKMTGGSEDLFGYGTVYGEKVDYTAFEDASRRFEEQDRMQFNQQQREYTQRDQEASSDKAWNFVVETTMFEREFEALGIDVSENEFDAYLYGTDGFSLLQDVADGFKDSITGLFNPKLLEKFIEEREASTDKNIQEQWENTKKSLQDRRKQEKYYALVGQGLYVTKLEAEEEYFAQKEKKNISYVVRRYSEISDEDIKVTDDDVLKYYEEHKNDKKYENKQESREVRWFDVTILPSKKDSSVFNKEMSSLKGAFAAAVNDSNFVMENSEMKFYTSSKFGTAVPEGHPKAQNLMINYPRFMDTIFSTASIGQVVGPFPSKDKIVLTKVIGFTPQKITARHILIGNNGSTDEKVIAAKQKTADSIVKLLNKDNFAEYVTKFSDDKGSVANGGEYTDFLEADMVPEFSDFCATKAIGTVGTVKTQYGIHIIEVLSRDAARFPVVAAIQKTFTASQETIDKKDSEVYNLLYKLEGKLSKLEEPKSKLDMFDTIVQQAGYFARPLNIMSDNPKMYGFLTSFAEDKILKLAFEANAKVGDLTTAPIKDKDRYVIAMVSSIREKGVPNFEDVEKVMRRDLIEELKAKRLMNQLMKDRSLDAMAKRSNSPVMKAEVTFATPQITGAGLEPEVIGALYSGLKDGTTSKPLKGKMGVYVVRVDQTIKAPATANYNVEIQQMLGQLRGGLQSQASSALKKQAEVVDNRRFLKIGLRR